MSEDKRELVEIDLSEWTTDMLINVIRVSAEEDISVNKVVENILTKAIEGGFGEVADEAKVDEN